VIQGGELKSKKEWIPNTKYHAMTEKDIADAFLLSDKM
jgi:hypothetical protein